MQRVAEQTGACVLGNHHPGKDPSRGARGSSAFTAAMDAELEMRGDQMEIVVTVTKMKDAPDGAEYAYRRVGLAESCVLEDTAGLAPEMSLGALNTLDVLRSMYCETGVAVTAWLAASEKPVRTFYDHRRVLIERGFVRNIGTKKVPRYQPIRTDGEWPND
jgi:hypothetical protein